MLAIFLQNFTIEILYLACGKLSCDYFHMPRYLIVLACGNFMKFELKQEFHLGKGGTREVFMAYSIEL